MSDFIIRLVGIFAPGEDRRLNLMIVTTAQLYKVAYGKFAVGAYNINNMEQLLGLFHVVNVVSADGELAVGDLES